MKWTVWFNHGMNLLADAIEVIQDVGDPCLRVISSNQSGFSLANRSDAVYLEPRHTLKMSDDEYAQWCLEFAVEHGVNLFVPSRGNIQIADYTDRFAEAGIKVMVPGKRGVMLAIQHKASLYRLLSVTTGNVDQAAPLPIPDWHIVNSLAELEAAYSALRDRHDSVCFKPATGIFGHGFRRIVEQGSALDRLMKAGPYTATSEIGWAEIRTVFGACERFEDLIVMPYLEGKEHSVDCLAHEGRLISCISRRKDSHDGQVMEKNAKIEAYIDTICAKLRLSGVFNVQFKDHGAAPYLLEINSRMSGGLHKACQAARFPLPYWAVRVALGLTKPEDVPPPRTGATIVKRKVYEIID